MKKVFIIIAIVLLVLGCAIFFAALVAARFDFKNFGISELQTKTYPVSEEFRNIQIDENTAEIAFALSEDGTCSIVCRESEKTTRTVTVEEGTLRIVSEEEIGWKNVFNLSFEEESVTVYLPKDAYETLLIETHTGDVDIPENLYFNDIDITGSTCDVRCGASVSNKLSIQLSTGDVTLTGISAGAIKCTVTTGDVRMQSVSCAGDVTLQCSTGRTTLDALTCKNLQSEGSTGRVQLKNVVVSGTIEIERGTGDVAFENSDAGEIRVKTSTGDVTGTLRTGKTFVTKTSTGDVKVPDSVWGGKCEITTTTGDIAIMITAAE